MPAGLERRYGADDFHFVTCSCYQRRPLLSDDRVKLLFLTMLEDVRQRYRFCVFGYVLMPEHFHLLMSEPEIGSPSLVLQVLKQRVARQVNRKHLISTLSPKSGERMGHPMEQFWQRRFYDFNVWTKKKRIEKLKYMHRNPVVRGLVEKPEDWLWSTFRHYALGEVGIVEIESEWTGMRREREMKVVVGEQS
jgi:putative transposase